VAPIRGEAVRASLWCLVPLLMACREEPTIVIKFEPADMSGAQAAKAPDLGAAKAPDLGAARTPDGGAAKKIAECKTAADCAVEPDGCCDCANGGKQRAIAKARAAASKQERAKHCADTMCTMMLSTDPTCGMRADCVSGACVMIKKPGSK